VNDECHVVRVLFAIVWHDQLKTGQNP
jgi:hypothetical protein